MQRFFYVLQALVFVAFLASPLVLPLVGVPAGRLAAGNRPVIPLSVLAEVPKRYRPALTAYARDVAQLRDHLIRANNQLRLAIFGESPVPTVIVGRDGWLFYKAESNLDDYLNIIPLAEQALADMVRVQVERRDWLAARGIAYLVVFAPNKERVYPEFMPKGLVPLHPLSRLEQIVPRLREAGVSVLDLREPLLAAKAERQAFQKTDTHWNAWGAFRGAAAIIDAVRQFRHELPELVSGEYTVENVDGVGGDLATLLLLQYIWRERGPVLSKRSPALARSASNGAYPDPADHPDRARVAMETDRADWPRMVYFRDSFTQAMIPYLAERSSRSVFLWSHAFAPEIIEAERPDVVVLEVVERYVYALTLANPEGVRSNAPR